MMSVAIERPAQPRTEAPSGRLRRPESEASPDWFRSGAGKGAIQKDLDQLTSERQGKLDQIEAAERRRGTDQKPLAYTVECAGSAVTEAQKILDDANRELRRARGALVAFNSGIDSEVEAGRRSLARSRDPQIREFLGWCDNQHRLTLNRASAKKTATGEPKYNIESGTYSTDVVVDYSRASLRLEALNAAKVKAEALSFVADADVGEQLDTLRASVPAL